MKRSLDDPYTSSAKARNQGHDDIQMDASTTAGSASKSSDKEQLIRNFINEFQRRPRMRSEDLEERQLPGHIQRNFSNLHPETIRMLNDLNDLAACAAFANSHLMQLANHTCSPPDDLVRILQVIAQVPSQSVILKEKFEFVREKAKGLGEKAPGSALAEFRHSAPAEDRGERDGERDDAFATAAISPYAYGARGKSAST